MLIVWNIWFLQVRGDASDRGVKRRLSVVTGTRYFTVRVVMPIVPVGANMDYADYGKCVAWADYSGFDVEKGSWADYRG